VHLQCRIAVHDWALCGGSPSLAVRPGVAEYFIFLQLQYLKLFPKKNVTKKDKSVRKCICNFWVSEEENLAGRGSFQASMSTVNLDFFIRIWQAPAQAGAEDTVHPPSHCS
jgi:hypothetical protein